MASRKRSLSNNADTNAIQKEWDEASCPICMDHPHNAVLLLCSSHDKGCRSYICDTSYRHSNCLDRFKKLQADDRNTTSPPRLSPTSQHRDTSFENSSYSTINDAQNSFTIASVEMSGRSVESGTNAGSMHFSWQGGNTEGGGSDVSIRNVLEGINDGSSLEARSSLRCPLCRGDVLGWEVVEEARKYLNSKSRSCSRETCSFSGSYRELRRHARRIHPSARPSNIDPIREQAWRHLEHQRDYGDIVSAIQTDMPGAVVFGDYVIENGGRPHGERERGSGDRDGQWWTTFFLFQMFGVDHAARRRRARSRDSTTRLQRSTGRPRYTWGRNLLGAQNDGDSDENDSDVNILSDTNEDASPVPRRRRRLTRYRSLEDRS